MADVGSLSICVGLTECCYCQNSLRAPVLLQCLHNCCRSCHDSLDKQVSQSTVECIQSCESSEANQVLMNCIPAAYLHWSLLQSDEAYCTTCSEGDIAAVYWCTDCSKLLCAICYTSHNTFSLQCRRSAELRDARVWSISQLIPAAQCSIHEQYIVAHCFTCRQPKCSACYSACYENCGTLKHKWRPLSHPETAEHTLHVIEAIGDAKQKLPNLLSGLMAKIRTCKNAVQKARWNGHSWLVGRKKRMEDSVIKEYKNAENKVLENGPRVLHKGSRVMARPQSTSESDATCAINHLHFLNAKNLPMRVSQSRIYSLGLLVRLQSKCLFDSGKIIIHDSMPVTAPMLLRACLGATDSKRASPHAPLVFGQATVSFPVPIDCQDLALTQNGRTLLAARQHGLLEYSDRGEELRRWRPTRRSNGWEDGVSCVAVLNYGRVAVGVVYARLVKLLRRCSETDDAWLEDRDVAVLESPPWRLAIRADLLAIADTEPGMQLDWLPGRRVRLTMLSTGELLSIQSRKYVIESVALSTLCVISMGNNRVKHNDGLKHGLIEAFSHEGKLLWQHKARDDELLTSVCSAETWNLVYVALEKRDQNSSRVIAIGGADGTVKEDVLSSQTHRLQAPALMSLSRGKQRTFLAALSLNRDNTGAPTLTLYEGVNVVREPADASGSQ